MEKEINPCHLDEEASEILSVLLSQTNNFVLRKGMYVVNINGENVSFYLTNTLICRQRIENTPQKAGYRYEVMSDQCLGEGGFGKVYLSIMTLGFEEGKLVPVPSQKSRVIKIKEKQMVKKKRILAGKCPIYI